VEGSILELLEQHGSLASEQVAALLQEPPDDVRNALNDLRERGLVDVVVSVAWTAQTCRRRRIGG
jgi:predicted ArsR family transcriptional regulator